MSENNLNSERLSPWWRNGVIITLIVGFSVLIYLATKTYEDAPPIPEKIVNQNNEIIFTNADIRIGQQIFLKYGLMENGTIWGHGAYLGPDFSAQYLHILSQDYLNSIAMNDYGKNYEALTQEEQDVVSSEVQRQMKKNRYDAQNKTLPFTAAEEMSFNKQVKIWKDYFSSPQNSYGLPAKFINNDEEIKHLTAFFAWTAWASVVNRPDENYSYTNNFPYDPVVGNTPGVDSILWSALSLISLLGITGLVLFMLGKFSYLGWKGEKKHVHPYMLPGKITESQKALVKYFVIVALLFLVQSLVGGATAHYRVEPGSFFGIDISSIFPSNIMRTWHLQLAIFWIATAYVAGGLLLAPALGERDPDGQVKGVNLLFVALIIVVVGSLVGEIMGINRMLENVWFWFGHQGWEYLDLGRTWQILLAIGLVIWLVLLFRAIAPARKDPERGEISSMFLYAALAIPVFYLPAMFFSSTTHFSVVDTWRFWIIHLWVEGFFELFVTVMVAIIFYRLGVVTHLTAKRVVYLDAILYLGAGIVGTAHHWYWTGQSPVAMALGATFSAAEVVPLTLLTLDAWDFVKLSSGKCEVCNKEIKIPHKWTFYFLMSVGFWNFVGAGIFGFLINLPIVSYFEVGTMFTPNHGHAAMMGVFGMLAIALMVFTYRQVLSDDNWLKIEKYVKYSFWGLNIGLASMVLLNLFPGGVFQLSDVLQNGYWHARSVEFLTQNKIHIIEWIRLPADIVFILIGVIPLLVASVMTYGLMKKKNV